MPYVKNPIKINLGIIFDLELKFDKQISAVVKADFFILEQFLDSRHF